MLYNIGAFSFKAHTRPFALGLVGKDASLTQSPPHSPTRTVIFLPLVSPPSIPHHQLPPRHLPPAWRDARHTSNDDLKEEGPSGDNKDDD
jgi:hypothetical protein